MSELLKVFYHLLEDGNPQLCRKPGQCEIPNSRHALSPEHAREVYERAMRKYTIPAPLRKF